VYAYIAYNTMHHSAVLNSAPKLSTNQPLSHTHHLPHKPTSPLSRTRTPLSLTRAHLSLSHLVYGGEHKHASSSSWDTHVSSSSNACNHVHPLQQNVYATREEETHAMIELACRLKIICSKYTCQDGAPLWLDVGMDSGNVTGKIVGKTKSFWC